MKAIKISMPCLCPLISRLWLFPCSIISDAFLGCGAYRAMKGEQIAVVWQGHFVSTLYMCSAEESLRMARKFTKGHNWGIPSLRGTRSYHNSDIPCAPVAQSVRVVFSRDFVYLSFCVAVLLQGQNNNTWGKEQ